MVQPTLSSCLWDVFDGSCDSSCGCLCGSVCACHFDDLYDTYKIVGISGTTHDGSRSINESAAWDYEYADAGINYADSIAESVTKFVLRFVERVCLEADINTDHVKTLQSLVPGNSVH